MSNFGSRISGFFGGATGGGGGGGLTSVAVDGTTIGGNGTVGNPLYSTTALPTIDLGVDLSLADYPLAGAGIYKIINDGHIFYFNNTNIVDGSRVLLIIDSTIANAIPVSGQGGVQMRYQGYFNYYEYALYLSTGFSYEFIYNATDFIWYCLNINKLPTKWIDIGGYTTPYDINTIGYYEFINTGGGAGINLPSPSAFLGQQITIINLDQIYPISITNNKPKNLDSSNVTQIPVQTSITIASVTSFWIVKSIYTV